MQVETGASGNEEAHFVFGVAVLGQKLRAGGGRRGVPVGVAVVGSQRGHIDVPKTVVGVDRRDLVSVVGQDPLGRPARVDARSKRSAIENDSPRGKLIADE